MRKHQFVVHTPYCDTPCGICDGGLGICSVCHCIEGSLATECPGFNCWKEYGDRIWKKEIDFKDGNWVVIEVTDVGT
jgi:hypothetical protein